MIGTSRLARSGYRLALLATHGLVQPVLDNCWGTDAPYRTVTVS
jgi:hypothetical protein